MTSPSIEQLDAKLDRLIETLGNHAAGERRWFGVEQAAEHMAISEESVRRLVSSGRLTAYRPVAGRLVLDRRQCDAVIMAATRRPATGRGRRKAVDS